MTTGGGGLDDAASLRQHAADFYDQQGQPWDPHHVWPPSREEAVRAAREHMRDGCLEALQQLLTRHPANDRFAQGVAAALGVVRELE